MGSTRTAEEAKQHNIEIMGEKLGSIYSELWQEVVAVHKLWFEYKELFGKGVQRIRLMNETTPRFFSIIQRLIQEEVILHIARITDPIKTGKFDNLTIQQLPQLVPDTIQEEVRAKVLETVVDGSFTRDWRNKKLAHRDLAHSLDSKASPLEVATVERINLCLRDLAVTLNLISGHFEKSETHFGSAPDALGAHGLVRTLWYAQKARDNKTSSSGFSEDDFPPRDL